MSHEVPDDHITRKTVVLRLPGMDEVPVRRDIEYAAGGESALTLDLYTPAVGTSSPPWPVVLSVAGYPDPGFLRLLGCRIKDMGSSTSWSRLVAASGMAAVTYTNREPATDVHSVLRYLRENAAALLIDSERIGLLAASGHGPLALATLMNDRSDAPLRCAALICPLLLDLGGFTAVAESARNYGFVNPAAGRTVDDLPPGTSLFIARAGLDETPGLNETLNRFVAAALGRNRKLTLMNLPDSPHAFDVLRDHETSREAVRAALRFLRFELRAGND